MFKKAPVYKSKNDPYMDPHLILDVGSIHQPPLYFTMLVTYFLKPSSSFAIHMSMVHYNKIIVYGKFYYIFVL